MHLVTIRLRATALLIALACGISLSASAQEDAGTQDAGAVSADAIVAVDTSTNDAGPQLAPVPAQAIPALELGPPGIPRARYWAFETPTQAELDDRESLTHPKCDPRWGLAFPGLGAFCGGRDIEGYVLLSAGAAELGTGIAVAFKNGITTPGAEVPLLGFGDLLTAVSLDAGIRVERARHLPYVPQDSIGDDFSAPFRLDVLRQPDVFLGIIGTVGLGLLYEQFIDGPLSTQSYGQKPQLFGHTVNSAVAYPISTAIGVGLFSQVAVAEELAFRGRFQSGLTRAYGEIPGWIYGSLIFGLFHASNAIFLPSNQRVDYLTHGVPFITLVGSYLGWTYMNHGYSLAPSIAVHFWYDFLIEAASFALDPKNSPLSFVYVF